MKKTGELSMGDYEVVRIELCEEGMMLVPVIVHGFDYQLKKLYDIAEAMADAPTYEDLMMLRRNFDTLYTVLRDYQDAVIYNRDELKHRRNMRHSEVDELRMMYAERKMSNPSGFKRVSKYTVTYCYNDDDSYYFAQNAKY